MRLAEFAKTLVEYVGAVFAGAMIGYQFMPPRKNPDVFDPKDDAIYRKVMGRGRWY
jgi:hypothetical protein